MEVLLALFLLRNRSGDQREGLVQGCRYVLEVDLRLDLDGMVSGLKRRLDGGDVFGP